MWRRMGDSNPRARKGKRFSRPPRYDHFDNPPSMVAYDFNMISHFARLVKGFLDFVIYFLNQ